MRLKPSNLFALIALILCTFTVAKPFADEESKNEKLPVGDSVENTKNDESPKKEETKDKGEQSNGDQSSVEVKPSTPQQENDDSKQSENKEIEGLKDDSASPSDEVSGASGEELDELENTETKKDEKDGKDDGTKNVSKRQFGIWGPGWGHGFGHGLGYGFGHGWCDGFLGGMWGYPGGALGGWGWGGRGFLGPWYKSKVPKGKRKDTSEGSRKQFIAHGWGGHGLGLWGGHGLSPWGGHGFGFGGLGGWGALGGLGGAPWGAAHGWPGWWYRSSVPKSTNKGVKKDFLYPGVGPDVGYGLGLPGYGYLGYNLPSFYGAYGSNPYVGGFSWPAFGFATLPYTFYKSKIPKKKNANQRDEVPKRQFIGGVPFGYGYPGWGLYGHPADHLGWLGGWGYGPGLGVPVCGCRSNVKGPYNHKRSDSPKEGEKRCGCGGYGGWGGLGWGGLGLCNAPDWVGGGFGGCGGCGGCGGGGVGGGSGVIANTVHFTYFSTTAGTLSLGN